MWDSDMARCDVGCGLARCSVTEHDLVCCVATCGVWCYVILWLKLGSGEILNL